MYLPATFQLGFDSKNYSYGFDSKHGDGFFIDRKNDKVITKFTCGLALLLSPFYCLGSIIDKIFSLNKFPYSNYYLFFISIGAAFYSTLGLFFLRKWLNYYVDTINSFLSIIIIFFGTNLYYYTLDESLMSHMYSFSLFSALLFGFKAFIETTKYKYFILFCITLSLAVLIRPTNVFFVFIALFLDVNSIEKLKAKLLLLFRPTYFFSGLLIFVLIILPQLFYWKFAYGQYIIWTYKDEGFFKWNDPQFLVVWFSPKGGLFPYTPILILSLIFSVVMLIKKEMNAALILFTFFMTSYMCASWCNPYFGGGCTFGKRPMIEYLPIIMLPISYMIKYWKSYPKIIRSIVFYSTIILIYYNQALFGAFNTCFWGDTWEWAKFGLLLKNALLFT